MQKNKIQISRLGIKQKSNSKNIIIKSISVFALVALLSFLFIKGFKYFEQHIRNAYLVNGGDGSSLTTWTSSLASYWGGILGGAVSGLIALGGTFIIINYYRKSDLSNRRIENQPFLNIYVKSKSTQLSNEEVLFELGEGEKCIYIKVSIKNIGKGFAQTLVYYDGGNFGGNAFRNTIESGAILEKEYVIKVKYRDNSVEESFAIIFMDCFLNEYIQSFEITVAYDSKIVVESTKLLCNYPELTATAFK